VSPRPKLVYQGCEYCQSYHYALPVRHVIIAGAEAECVSLATQGTLELSAFAYVGASKAG
jgi:hypothetical protein